MTGRTAGLGRVVTHAFLGAVVVFCCARGSHAQGNGLERTFPQSKARVEKALQEMQPATAGRLPVLEGFAASADHPLDRYLRGYYQARFQVAATPSGGSIVRVSVEVTAWYADPVAARSGYQVLTSNGRLEGDLLDQLTDQLSGKGSHIWNRSERCAGAAISVGEIAVGTVFAWPRVEPRCLRANSDAADCGRAASFTAIDEGTGFNGTGHLCTSA